MNSEDTEKMVIEQGKILSRVDGNVNDIIRRLDSMEQTFVSKNEFTPVRNVAYGLTAGILMTVLGIILTHTLS